MKSMKWTWIEWLDVRLAFWSNIIWIGSIEQIFPIISHFISFVSAWSRVYLCIVNDSNEHPMDVECGMCFLINIVHRSMCRIDAFFIFSLSLSPSLSWCNSRGTHLLMVTRFNWWTLNIYRMWISKYIPKTNMLQLQKYLILSWNFRSFNNSMEWTTWV